MSEFLEAPSQVPVWHHLAVLDATTGEVMNVSRALRAVDGEPHAAVLSLGQVGFELTAEQYAMVTSELPHRVVAGVLEGFTRVIDIGKFRAGARARVDASAEQARLAFITPGSGQALEYQATQAEALAVLAAGVEPSAASAPWLAAERDAMAAVEVTVTLLEVAGQVVALQAQWVQAGAAIKRIRRKAKMLIGAAGTPAEIEAIRAALVWPAPQ